MADWVDAGPIREHIRSLLAQNMPAREIERAAKLAPSDVTVILHGTTGHPRLKRISAARAQRILSVTAGRAFSETGGLYGFRAMRRVRALAARGWRIQVIASGSRLGQCTLANIAAGKERRITKGVFDELDAFYQKYKFKPGDSIVSYELAAKKQWPPAEAWPDNSIDGAEAEPDWTLVDAAKIRRAVSVKGAHGRDDAKRIPIGTVRKHVRSLLNQGMPLGGIARRSGRRYVLLYVIAHQRSRKWVSRADAKAILAVIYDPVVAGNGVLAIGARRRVQAMQWNKWRLSDIALCSGLGYVTVANISSGKSKSISVKTFGAIEVLYEGNWNYEGVAERRGDFPPPAAWDVDTFDDPDAIPALRQVAQTADERRTACREDIEFLILNGVHVESAAERLGLSVRQLVHHARQMGLSFPGESKPTAR